MWLWRRGFDRVRVLNLADRGFDLGCVILDRGLQVIAPDERLLVVLLCQVESAVVPEKYTPLAKEIEPALTFLDIGRSHAPVVRQDGNGVLSVPVRGKMCHQSPTHQQSKTPVLRSPSVTSSSAANSTLLEVEHAELIQAFRAKLVEMRARRRK